jgi:hypothetical protein
VKKEKRKKPVGTSSSSSSASKKTKASNVGDYNDVMVIEKEKLPNPVINLQEKDLGGDDDLVVVGEQVSALSQYALSSLYPILTPPPPPLLAQQPPPCTRRLSYQTLQQSKPKLSSQQVVLRDVLLLRVRHQGF